MDTPILTVDRRENLGPFTPKYRAKRRYYTQNKPKRDSRMMGLKGFPVAVPIPKPAQDAATAARLWSETEQLVGQQFDLSAVMALGR
jgi:hypothetical protein